MNTEDVMSHLVEIARRVPGVDTNKLADSLKIGHYAERVHTAVDKYTEVLTGLSVSRFKVLRNLFHNPGHSMTPAELADRIYLTRASMTTALDGLEKLGYVQRTPHPDDRRMLSVKLTPKGIRYMEKLLPGYYRDMMSVLGKITKKERENLLCIYKKLSDSVDGFGKNKCP